MRRAARIDVPQPDIVQAIREIGGEVTHLHALGRGVADILISWRQQWVVMEIKDGTKPPSKQRLTPDEARWIGRQKAPVYVVTSAAEAVGILTMMRP